MVCRVTASDLREAPLRRAPVIICSALLLLTVLTASLCTASASSAATTYPALRCRVISHRGTYVVVRGHQRTVVVRARQWYARGRDRLPYRVVKRTYGCVVLRRVSTRYGCVKPVTTRTVRNLYIRGGTHDVTYSNVRFEGYTGSESADWTCVGMAAIGSAGSISNITFERCVFATVPAGVFGNAFHMWNTSTVGSTISNITFRDCWFEPQPRMQIEMNGFGGWWHDVTIDHCTFEPGGGEMVSVSMSPVDGAIPAPYGVTVGGVVRGVEGLHITGNDFRGTGVTVNGFAPKWEFGFEFACVFPYARDKSIGRSEFSGSARPGNERWKVPRTAAPIGGNHLSSTEPSRHRQPDGAGSIWESGRRNPVSECAAQGLPRLRADTPCRLTCYTQPRPRSKSPARQAWRPKAPWEAHIGGVHAS